MQPLGYALSKAKTASYLQMHVTHTTLVSVWLLNHTVPLIISVFSLIHGRRTFTLGTGSQFYWDFSLLSNRYGQTLSVVRLLYHHRAPTRRERKFFIDTFMAHGRRRAIALCTVRATLLVIFSFYKIIIVWWINSLFSSILGWPSFLSVYTNSRDIWCSILRKKGSMADDKTLLNTINGVYERHTDLVGCAGVGSSLQTAATLSRYTTRKHECLTSSIQTNIYLGFSTGIFFYLISHPLNQHHY